MEKVYNVYQIVNNRLRWSLMLSLTEEDAELVSKRERDLGNRLYTLTADTIDSFSNRREGMAIIAWASASSGSSLAIDLDAPVHPNPNYKTVTLSPRPDACVLKIKLTQIFRFPLWYILEKDLGFISVFFADFFQGILWIILRNISCVFTWNIFGELMCRYSHFAPMRPLRMADLDGFAMVNVESDDYLILTLLLLFYSLHYSRTDSPVECNVGHIPKSLSPFRATDTCSICPSSARMTPHHNCVAIIFLKNRSHALQSQESRIM